MDLKSKYNLNDEVFSISQQHHQIEYECKTCAGTGEVAINNTPPRECPDCHGCGYRTQWDPLEWAVSLSLHIGRIECQAESLIKTGDFDNFGVYDPGNITFHEEYMCYETGIGSGNTYLVDRLFPSKEAAQAECDARNLVKT